MWSQVTIAGQAFDDFYTLPDRDKLKQDITHQVKTAAYEIIKRKGATDFAVGMAVVNILSAIMRDENRILTISTLLPKEMEFGGVCLSVPTILNANGVSRLVPQRMEGEEKKQFETSVEAVSQSIQSILA